MNELKIIARYICLRLAFVATKKIDNSDDIRIFLKNSLLLLERLIDDPADATKDPINVKASRQMLCCIGIDLRHNNVEAEHLFNIFSEIDFSSTSIEAAVLIHNTIFTKNLLHTHSNVTENNDFAIFICPIQDWHYYISPLKIGVSGADRRKFAREKVIKYISGGNALVSLRNNQLKKCSNSFFWTTTSVDFNRALELGLLKHIYPNSVSYIVDALGLSHFCSSFNDPWYKHFIAINLGNLSIQTAKPNFTNIAWSTPSVGFLSSYGISGVTCCITGNDVISLSEKVFLQRITVQDEQKQISISLLPDNHQPEEINSNLIINCNFLINKGIERFFNNAI